MARHSKHILGAAFFFIIATGMIYLELHEESSMATVNLKIEKQSSDDTWRVRDNNGVNRGTVVVQRLDNIFFQPRGSDMVFSIPNVKRYFNVPDGMFQDGYTQRVADNMMLRLDVRDDAPQDSIVYNVFVISEGKYVVGNSPPIMIIR